MAEIIAATYDSKRTVTNVVDDLVSTGIPREKIRVNEDAQRVSVMAPDVSEPEIREILARHQPTDLSVR
jgi:hypothetical protein